MLVWGKPSTGCLKKVPQHNERISQRGNQATNKYVPEYGNRKKCHANGACQCYTQKAQRA